MTGRREWLGGWRRDAARGDGASRLGSETRSGVRGDRAPGLGGGLARRRARSAVTGRGGCEGGVGAETRPAVMGRRGWVGASGVGQRPFVVRRPTVTWASGGGGSPTPTTGLALYSGLVFGSAWSTPSAG